MTSKSSFLANIRENNKRRLWVWVISALIFMLALPIMTALMLNGMSRQLDGWVTYYGLARAQQMVKEQMLETMKERFGFMSLTAFLTAGMAVVSAVQGFSWLYSRKKIDFYMGMPVKRKKRFFLIWLNGILLYALPYLLGTVISLLIAAGSGAVDASVLAAAVVSYGIYLCLFLGVFHVAILAVMMTGNIVITGFALLVFYLYEFMVRVTLSGYRQMFFRYHTNYGSSEAPAISPFTLYADFVNAYEDNGIFEVKYLVCLILFALAAGALAYICYLKRPAETAGKAMAFAVTKPVVKILLAVPGALLAGLVVAEVIEFNPLYSQSGIGYMIMAIALVVVIGSAMIQVIYEFDIKGALHKKGHIVISGVIAAAVFAVFQFDLFGFDDYVPRPEQIESVAFVPDYYEQTGGGVWFDEEGNYLSNQSFADQYMHLTNGEDICALAELSMVSYNEMMQSVRGMSGNMASWDGEAEESTDRWSQVMLIYRLKSGRKVYRDLWVNVEDKETAGLLDRIIGSQEFKEGYFVSASEHLEQLFDLGKYQITATYGNMVYKEKLSEDETREFLAIYRRDLSKANFSNLKANVPKGLITLLLTEDLSSGYGIAKGTRSWELNLNVYPFYEESIAWLQEKGYDLEQHIDLEDVAKIQVLNLNYDIREKLQKQQREQEGMEEAEAASWFMDYDSIDTRVYADYVDAEDMEKLAECIYPQEMIVRDWDYGKELDSNYRVIVYFKTDSGLTKEYGTYADYGFLAGEVPDFVRVDTAYKE